MSGWVLLAAFLLAVGIISALLRTLDFGSPVRDVTLAMAAGRLKSRDPRPESVERTYWSHGEYKRDAARLAQLGYEVTSETDTSPHVEGFLYRGLPTQRRVPIAHVLYELRKLRVV
jgi:hypothetical protein